MKSFKGIIGGIVVLYLHCRGKKKKKNNCETILPNANDANVVIQSQSYQEESKSPNDELPPAYEEVTESEDF